MMRGVFVKKRGVIVKKCGVGVLLALGLILGDFAGVAPEEARAAPEDCVGYIAITVSSTGVISKDTSASRSGVEVLDASSTTWGTASQDTWYISPDNDLGINARITVVGNVNLILRSGKKLTAEKGITVTGDNSLTIYAQSEDESQMGELVAGVSGSIERGYAGIGGAQNQSGQNITINGGKVTALGGGGNDENNDYGGAGIGGGYQELGKNITINGGKVTATSQSYGAGIGGGGEYGDGHHITINGGTVTATGGGDGAGIGGGDLGKGSNITINGGTVNAIGGEDGAGIGGGSRGDGEDIAINGETVIAIGGDKGAGIGGGIGHTANRITINNGDIVACGGPMAAGIGSGYGGYDPTDITIKGNSIVSVSGGGGYSSRPSKKGAGIGTGAPAGNDYGNEVDPTYYISGLSSSGKIYYYEPGTSLDAIKNDTSHTSPSIWRTITPLTPTVSAPTQAATLSLDEGYTSTNNYSVTATSLSPSDTLSYKWYESTTAATSGGTEISGATSTSFTTPTGKTAGTYYYYCTVTATRNVRKSWNDSSTLAITASTTVPLVTMTVTTVLTAPTISSQPSNLNLTEGYTGSNTLSITATSPSGDGVDYQWYSNTTNDNTSGTLLTGETNSTYSVPTGLSLGDHFYYCIASSTRNSTTVSTISAVAKVTVSQVQAPVLPTTPTTTYDPPAPEPKINGGSGWSSITKEISKTSDGGTLQIDMNGTTTLPASVTEAIKGKDVNLVLDMGGGIRWKINGKDVTSSSGNINLAVKLNSSLIPVDVINNLTKERYVMQISLAQKGAFGFKAVLTVPMRVQDAGLFANLYRWVQSKSKPASVRYGVAGVYALAAEEISDNSTNDAGTMEFMSAGKIAEDGSVDLAFDGTKALADDGTNSFAIVVDDHSLDPSIKPEQEVTPTPKLTLKATSKGGKVTLSWNKLKGVKKYKIYKKSSGEFKCIKMISKNASKTTKYRVKKGLKAGKKYTFAIRALVGKSWTKIVKSSKATVKVK